MALHDAAAVDRATEVLLGQDVRILNGALFGPGEAEHVNMLLDLLDPPQDAMIIDAGCGVGEMARLMAERRPDLNFLLVNTSAAQLALCPVDFDRLVADFDAMTDLPDGCADVVVFSYSLCHSDDWTKTLREARRVLKDGGKLFINDMARLDGANDELERVLGARAHEPEMVEAWAAGAGLDLDFAIAPPVQVDRLREVLDADGVDTALLDDVVPTVWRFTAVPADQARWLRHRGRIGFQFSGGRDSTAALYLLRHRWGEMTVYHLDTGDQFPETQAVSAQVRADVEAAGGTFVTIATDVAAYRAGVGWSSDVVPTGCTPIGQHVTGHTARLVDRYECCWQNLMGPMQARMAADGITLIVRGTRDDEFAEPLMRDGDSAAGFEVHYPVGAWTGEQVSTFLLEQGLPIAPFYEAGLKRAPECMHCTAWLDEGRVGYLRQYHPEVHGEVLAGLQTIDAEVARAVFWLKHELEA